MNPWKSFKAQFRDILAGHLGLQHQIFLKHAINPDTKEPYTKDELPLNVFIRKMSCKSKNNINFYNGYIVEEIDKINGSFISFKIDVAHYNIVNSPYVLSRLYMNVNKKPLN